LEIIRLKDKKIEGLKIMMGGLTMDLMTLMVLIAGVVMIIVGFIAWEISGRWVYLTSRNVRRLKKADANQYDEGMAELPQNSIRYKLKEAHINLSPLQFYFIAAGLGILGALLCWTFFITGLPALAIGGILVYLPFAYIQEQASSRGRKIDELLPIALSRIAPGIQVSHSLDEVLEEVARSLDVEGSNPLSPELLKTARDIRTRSTEQALADLAKRSPSISLSNTAMLLGSYHRAGGGQYADVFSEAAWSIQRIIAVRTHAQSKAAQPLQSARLIPVMLGVVLFAMMSDPTTRASFNEPLVQIMMAVAVGVMVLGYLYMRNEVLKAV
jgi:tight adherence protein B